MDEVGVSAWERAGVLLERFTYGPGPKAAVPVHTHEHYQWCLSVDAHGCYAYRGAHHPVPATAVSVIHPLEPHASIDPDDRVESSTYLLVNIPVATMAEVLSGLGLGPGRTPFFRQVVSLDADIRRRFVSVHRASTVEPDRLAFDTALLALLHRAVAAMAEPTVTGTGSSPDPPRVGPERRAVAVVRDYLHHNATRPVPIADLAGVAGLSQRHLFRAFKTATGVPPHRYQLQLRIDRAKHRLARGDSPADVAADCGFSDQSHLARQFKRYVGCPPGRYRTEGQP